ncbi:hypothetical protein ACJRO7_018474 [Eucalyptus globulus]|uniref:Uncharacterized protein n=1 Tax=Eucalyptus globulus TaxID=34317 RepID=A0ABD3KTV8_EUCGL
MAASLVRRRKSKEQSGNGAHRGSRQAHHRARNNRDHPHTHTRRAQKLEIQGSVVRQTVASLVRWRKSKEQRGNGAHRGSQWAHHRARNSRDHPHLPSTKARDLRRCGSSDDGLPHSSEEKQRTEEFGSMERGRESS